MYSKYLGKIYLPTCLPTLSPGPVLRLPSPEGGGRGRRGGEEGVEGEAGGAADRQEEGQQQLAGLRGREQLREADTASRSYTGIYQFIPEYGWHLLDPQALIVCWIYWILW